MRLRRTRQNMQVYNYLEEARIGVEAGEVLSTRVRKNFDEIPTDSKEDMKVFVEQGEETRIIKDKRFPYAITKPNEERGCEGYDFFRYNTKTYTIWRTARNNFYVINYIRGNEDCVLRCVKKWYYQQPSAETKANMHASAVIVGNHGFLIMGVPRSGKTTLTANLLEKLGSSLVSEENTLVSYDGNIQAHYIPKPIHIKFRIIADSPRLSQVISNLDLCEAMQILDEDFIDRIINEKLFDMDASLNIARRSFGNLLGIRTFPKTRVSAVIFPEYSHGEKPSIRIPEFEEVRDLLRQSELSKSDSLGKLRKAYEKEQAVESLFSPSWVSDLRRIKVSFDGSKDLTKTFLEEIIK